MLYILMPVMKNMECPFFIDLHFIYWQRILSRIGSWLRGAAIISNIKGIPLVFAQLKVIDLK